MRAPIFLQGIHKAQNVQSLCGRSWGGGGRELKRASGKLKRGGVEGGVERGSYIKGTKQTVAVVATLGQVRQSSDYRSVEAGREGGR